MARRRPWHLVVVAALLLWPRPQYGYSVQTHEQLVDLVWKPAIVPLLRERYPGLTDAQLNEAHAYAYGGCAIQDLGYYPFGKMFFSDLTHYVRSGDFVRSLLRNARNADELAFAIGALTHYIGDTTGHALAVNPSVAAEFPKLEAKYGPVVTYEQSPHAHVQAEFAFDINEIAHHRFAPSRYLQHVGLLVATDLLARAFHETYGLRLEDVLGKKLQRGTIGGYRFAVRSFLPRIAYALNVLHGKRMPDDIDDADFQALEKALAQSDFENGWDPYRKKPGIGTYSLAGLIYILPKVGPLALLKIKGPDQASEQAYVKSVNATIAGIRSVVADVERQDGAKIASDLANRDLDTGQTVRPGGYRLTDETYANLLHAITKPGAQKIPAGLQADVERYYADPAAPIVTKKNPAKWAQVQAELTQLRGLPALPEP